MRSNVYSAMKYLRLAKEALASVGYSRDAYASTASGLVNKISALRKEAGCLRRKYPKAPPSASAARGCDRNGRHF